MFQFQRNTATRRESSLNQPKPVMTELTLPNARPYGFQFPPSRTALLLIDLQRDFLDPDGFGAIQCGDPAIFAAVRQIVPTIQRVLERARGMGMYIIHTREGHRPELTDLPPAKRDRQISAPKGHHTLGIGDKGPMGRLLVRGEYGHDIIDELTPRPGELVIDKPGKGSFWGTSLHRDLLARGITHLIVGGVTTECCVTTTIRECNDRGYQCCLLTDCTDGFDAQMVTTAMDTVCAQDGLFGFVGHSSDFLAETVASVSCPAPTGIGKSLPSIKTLLDKFHTGEIDPISIVDSVYERIDQYQEVDPTVWAQLRQKGDVLAEFTCLAAKHQVSGSNRLDTLPPLFGIPFGVTRNINIAGLTSCKESDTTEPEASHNAPAVQSLINAGAICIGKLNLDQLDTNLQDCCFGAAAAVGAGLISFALASDTIGGGLAPSSHNMVTCLKPTRGTVSARGVAPMCPSLDAVCIIAREADEARIIWRQIAQYDPQDPYARPSSSLPTWHVDYRGHRPSEIRFAIPPTSVLAGLCSPSFQKLFSQTVDALVRAGATLVEVNYDPFQTAGDLIFSPNRMVQHELIATRGEDSLRTNFPCLHPSFQGVYRPLLFPNDTDKPISGPWGILRDQARRAECTHWAQEIFNPLNADGIDVLLVPTIPFHPPVDENEMDPLELASKMAVFTGVVNLLDLCAVTVNVGLEPDTGKLFSISFLGGMGYDAKVLDIVISLKDMFGVPGI